MIDALIGLPGSGKTYEATRRLLLDADSGRQCYSVTPINHPNVETITYDDLLDPGMPPGTILLDEVHVKLPSSAGVRLPHEWLVKLSQTRHAGHDLIWTSQHQSRVLKQLRDNTNYGWQCSSWGSWKGHPAFMAATCYPMTRFGKGKPIQRFVHAFEMRVATAYDTTHSITEGIDGVTVNVKGRAS
jgi:hypothetical protein